MIAIPSLLPPSLLDTDTLSELMRARNVGVLLRAATYEMAHDRFSVSAITIMEAVSGWQRIQREDRIDELLRRSTRWEILTADRDVCLLAGRIHGDLARTGQPIGFADVLIAATALHHGLVLVTGNTAHYQRLQPLGYHLQLDNWRL